MQVSVGTNVCSELPMLEPVVWGPSVLPFLFWMENLNRTEPTVVDGTSAMFDAFIAEPETKKQQEKPVYAKQKRQVFIKNPNIAIVKKQLKQPQTTRQHRKIIRNVPCIKK